MGLPSPKMIYVESFARVRSLSLSGKLLRSFVDRSVGLRVFHAPQMTNPPTGLSYNGRTYYKKVVGAGILVGSSKLTSWLFYSCSPCNACYSPDGPPSDTIRTSQSAKRSKFVERGTNEVTAGIVDTLQYALISPPGISRVSSIIL